MKKKREAGVKRLSPRATIRAYCLHCVGGSAPDVRACDANNPKYHVCPFHPYRLGKNRSSAKVIRRFCLQCMGGSFSMVEECDTSDCLCHPYRMGKHPGYKGREKNLKNRVPMKGFSGKFERSPMTLTPNPSRVTKVEI